MDTINFVDTVSLVSTICRCNTAQLISRPHLTTMYMRPIVADGVAWCVCLSAGRSVTILSAAKRLNRSRCRLGCGLRWAQGTMYYRRGSRCTIRRGNFEEKLTCTASGWLKEQAHNNSSTAGSERWRNAEPSAFQLQETRLKSDKI